MFDVLMYLFETYIHNEAELRVDQDKLERILPTLVLIVKTFTTRYFGWKSLLTIRMVLLNLCSWHLTLFLYVFILRKSAIDWMQAVEDSCYSRSRFRC